LVDPAFTETFQNHTIPGILLFEKKAGTELREVLLNKVYTLDPVKFLRFPGFFFIHAQSAHLVVSVPTLY
jgi:hypothetical protein